MFTIILQRLLKDKSLNILVSCVHPGIVNTDLFKETMLGSNKWLMFTWKVIIYINFFLILLYYYQLFIAVIICLLQTPDQAATSVIHPAVSKDIERKGGKYFSNCKEIAIPPLALEEEVQERLFELSLKQTHLKDFFQYL